MLAIDRIIDFQYSERFFALLKGLGVLARRQVILVCLLSLFRQGLAVFFEKLFDGASLHLLGQYILCIHKNLDLAEN